MVERARISFVIRIPCSWCIKEGDEFKSLKDLEVERGRKGIWIEGATINRSDPLKVNLWVSWDEEEKEGWYLASNLASGKEAKRSYGLRMRIEESFRDKKSKMGIKRLWRWRNREHVYRMLLMVAFVMLFFVLVVSKDGQKEMDKKAAGEREAKLC